MSTTPQETDVIKESLLDSELFYGKESAEPSEEEPTNEESAVIKAEDAEPVEDAEESESAEDENDNQDAGETYVEIEGEAVSLKQIADWKHGHMMQEDYTRKRQADAKDRKQLDVERGEVDVLKQDAAEKVATLQVILDEQTLTTEQLQELKEDEPLE